MADEQYELTDEPKGPDTQDGQPSAPVVDKSILGEIQDVPAGTIKNALVKVGISDEVLIGIRQKAKTLLSTWTGTGTKEQYDAVKRFRLDIRPLRVAIEKAAKEGREEAIKVQRLWLDAQKVATTPLTEVEDQMAAKESIYEAEVQRVADEKARVERERVMALFAQLQAVEWRGNELVVAQMTPEAFESELKAATAAFEEVQAFRKAEAERKAKEEKEAAELAERNRLEAVRLAEVQAEQDRKAAQQRAEAEKLERDKAEAEAQRQKALAEVEEARQKAWAEVAEAKAKAEREAREAKEKADREEADRKAAAEAAEVKRQADLAQAEADRVAEQKRLEAEAEAERQRVAAAPDREKLAIWGGKIADVLKEAPRLTGELEAFVVGIHRDISIAIDAVLEASK